MSIDLDNEWKKADRKVRAAQAYQDLRNQYQKAQKKVGETYEKANAEVQTAVNKVNKGVDSVNKAMNTATDALELVDDQIKSYQRQLKNQFDKLLDFNNLTGGKGSGSARYIKKLLLTAVKNIEPKLKNIVLEESFKAVGCDQNQTYSATSIYISVKSIDIGGVLRLNPQSKVGQLLYEKDSNITPQPQPYSMNRQLYERIQQPGVTYQSQYNQLFRGTSNQDLFDISFVETNDLGVSGGWFKVDLSPRSTNVLRVFEFMSDYFSTVKFAQFEQINANIMNSLTGAVSIKANVGLQQAKESNIFELLVQRILGLCFDFRSEIDVSGTAKVSELDGVDESFFELTDIDLRYIDQQVSNLQNGVMQFEECDYVKLPVDVDAVVDDLTKLLFVKDEDLVDAADNLTKTLTNNPNWDRINITGNVNVAVDLNFIKLIVQGIVSALVGPKVLLPIFIMIKSLGQNFPDKVNSYLTLVKNFPRYIIAIVSKVGALFVEELFMLIKKDIAILIQQIIADVAKELGEKKIAMILKLIEILLILASLISDWRKCKSVLDELLRLLNIALSSGGFSLRSGLPLPLLYAAQLLDGYSESRAFVGTIEELQKIGIPTGPMPDGSPNLQILSMFSQMKAVAKEEAENNKIEVAVGPLTITPAGLSIPSKAVGKKF